MSVTALLLAVLVSVAPPTPTPRQATLAERSTLTQGTLVVEELHVRALEGNLLGDPVERSVTTYLPPSYGTATTKRYPVVYLLHGVGDTDARWRASSTAWRSIESIMNEAIAEGSVGEMIVVMPSCRSSFLGGMYTDSPVHGGFETYLTAELLAHVDTRYRTLDDARHRGVGGHSMGGYAALRYGMLHADVYGAIYALNAGVVGWHSDLSHENLAFDWAARIDSLDELRDAHFWPMALLSAAHAWSPAVDDPPLYAHLPFHWDRSVPHLVPNEPHHAAWEANMPLTMVERADVQANLRTLRGLRFDTALVDEFTHIPPTNRALSERLTELGIPHVFEMYNGNHRNRLLGEGGRLHTEFFPYFSRLLDATPPPPATY